jgi:hypothetical protein
MGTVPDGVPAPHQNHRTCLLKAAASAKPPLLQISISLNARINPVSHSSGSPEGIPPLAVIGHDRNEGLRAGKPDIYC